METEIRVLSENIINKIAAGEVVERPASVVKELVENSIDAGAQKVHVSISAGGKQSIVVSDDGGGMRRSDVPLCYLRHATSKMRAPNDLFNIQTLGFRGEALASIGAVAMMSIETRHSDELEGTRLVVEGGLQRELHSIGRARGTTISVRQLFFNTPARRKFMRHIDTEARHITQVIVHLAAAYPRVGFELEHQERNVLRFRPTTRQERALELLGLSADDVLQVELERDGVLLNGAISTPSQCRKSKAKQYLMVRNRPVYARMLVNAIYQGYSGLLPEGAHPSFLCWLDLDPKAVDVNVHPSKREIRIANESAVAEIVQMAVRQSVGLDEEIHFAYKKEDKPLPSLRDRGEFTSLSFIESVPILRDADRGVQEGSGETEIDSRPNLMAEQSELSLAVPDAVDINIPRFSVEGEAYEQLWQVHEAYIICPLEEALLVVDQQAAHERVLYEEARHRLEGRQADIQQLLFPLVLRLGSAEYALALQVIEPLRALGFDVREFGDCSLMVDGMPSDLENWNEGEVLRDILAEMQGEQRKPGLQLEDSIAVAYARHGAIKQGRKLELGEMQSLMQRLMAADESFICPRGKPTMVKVMRRDLDRLFGRA